MIKVFTRIRKQLLSENKFTKYVLYAIGEIVLVVIGILIALQINNNNDIRKARAKEVHYLVNIKSDLKMNIMEMDNYLQIRNQIIEAAQRILQHFEGEAITDYSAFNADGMLIYNWQKFYQSNNTFQELLNSGNLAMISNDSIKNMLLNIESLYKKMKSEEDHFRFDTESLIYAPLYGMMDLNPLVNDFTYRVSNGNAGKNEPLTEKNFKEYLKDTKLKNGFLMTVLEMSTMTEQMSKMKSMSEELIKLIEKETQKE